MMEREDVDRIAEHRTADYILAANEDIVNLVLAENGPGKTARLLRLIADMIERGETGAGRLH